MRPIHPAETTEIVGLISQVSEAFGMTDQVSIQVNDQVEVSESDVENLAVKHRNINNDH